MSTITPSQSYVMKIAPIEAFYDSLHDRQCTAANYGFKKKVSATRGCTNGEDYCKMYLASDMLTLLYIVSKNMDKKYEKFGLDLGYYFLTIQLVMDLILKISDEKIGLITDGASALICRENPCGDGLLFLTGIVSWKLIQTGQSTSEKSNAVL